MKKYERECRKIARYQFTKHTAQFIDGNTIVWGQGNSLMGRIEYRKLSPNLLSISGDYGHSEFLWHSGPEGVSFADIASFNDAYILEKLVAAPVNIPGLYTWNSGVAMRVVKEHVSANVEALKGTAPSPDLAVASWLEFFDEQSQATRECVQHPTSSEEAWLSFMDEVVMDDYVFNGIDFEEMHGIGCVPHQTFYTMIEGLRMALEQWRNVEVELCNW